MKVGRDSAPIAKGRLLVGVLLVAVSTVAAYYLQPLIHGKTDAINTVVTVFSILAGFLIAVITFIGEPNSTSWKDLQLGRSGVKAKLTRHLLLFYLYLLTLGLAMGMFLIPETQIILLSWFERLFIFCAVFVFGASFALPHSLRALQMEKYDHALDGVKPEVLKKPK